MKILRYDIRHIVRAMGSPYSMRIIRMNKSQKLAKTISFDKD
jgi:hypothetical protein